MNENNCFFTGHRHIAKNRNAYIKARLSLLVLKMIKKDVTCFICGGALGFDTMAAQMVLNYRKIFPHISLMLFLPCKNQTKGWRQKDIDIFNDILKKADKAIYLSEEYYSGCMHKRNCAMVDASAYGIAFLEENRGGTYFTVNYARKQGRSIEFI